MVLICFDEYNRMHADWKYGILKTWVLCPTNNHYSGVAVFWHEETNRLSCFSQSWPHDGWLEFWDGKINFEHTPWDFFSEPGWFFIGEL